MKFLDLTGLSHFLDKLKSLKGSNNGFAGLDKNGFIEEDQLLYRSKEVIYFTKQVSSTTMASVGSSLVNPKYVLYDTSKKRFVASNTLSSSIYTNCQAIWTQTSEEAYKASASFGSQDGTNGITPKTGVIYYDEEKKKTYEWNGSSLKEVDYSVDSSSWVKKIYFNLSSSLTSPNNTISHDIAPIDNKVGFQFVSPLVAMYKTYKDPTDGSRNGIQTIQVAMLDATSSRSGFMTSTQAGQLSNLYSSHYGKTYLPLSGGTVSGSTTFNKGLIVNGTLQSKGQGIEIYASTPFIDFHYGNSTADYTSRIIETSSGVLDINGLQINRTTGQVALKGATFDKGLALQDGLVVGDYTQTDNAGYYAIFCAGGILHNTASGPKFGIYANGNAMFAGTVTAKSHVNSSDIRLKENIKSISEDIDKIEDIEFFEFNYKSDKNKIKSYGVIAQDLEKVGLDNLVVEDDKGYKSVDYTALIMLELQRLREKNAVMEKRLAEIEKTWKWKCPTKHKNSMTWEL